jgi:hypothetical protein
VDPGDGDKPWRVRLLIGPEGQPKFLSPWIPYHQIAGALKVHTPPSVGQQMTMLNPTGDFRQAVVIPLTWSDAIESPSRRGDEHVLTFGQVRITIREDRVIVKVGEREILVTTEEVRTVGRTVLGMDSEEGGESARVRTVDGVAEQVFAKPGVFEP